MAERAASSGEPTLDLHGLYVRDALRRADAFLRVEQARGTVSVHIITGHGTGALKDALSDFLAGHPSVARVTTPLRGDAGRRIVLRPPARNTARG